MNQAYADLKKQIHDDIEIAYGWYANLCMAMYTNDIPIPVARKAANDVMKVFFDYDMLANEDKYKEHMTRRANDTNT